jgi:signal transduction histidine kinase/ligand-binding sensor domain-containing protein
MRPRALALVAAILMVSPVARALDGSKRLSGCTVDTWRSRDGLPGAWLRAIGQSPDGYLWLGTQGGVARYGGGRFVQPQPKHAYEDAVTDLVAARDGTIWILPSRGPPLCVRGSSFTSCFARGEPFPEGLRMADAQEDGEGTIWLAGSDGIHSVRAGHLQRVHPASAWGSASVTTVHRDRGGRLWVGTSAGLFSSTDGPLVAYPLPGHEAAAVSAIFEGPSGALWVVAERALVRLDGAGPVLVEGSGELRRPTQGIQDRDGNVWIGTRGGLARFQPGRGFVVFTRADGLPDDDVTSVFEDREGSLWVGTRGGGLAQFTDRTLDGQSGPPSLRDQWISTVAVDGEGALWTGTALGLTRWKDGHERTFTTRDGLPTDEVLSVQPGGQGVVWVGTAAGLARWKDGRIDRPVPVTSPVASLFLDQAGVLWLAVADGLARLEGEHLRNIQLEDTLKNAGGVEIRAIQRDDRGTVWVSAAGRLLRVDGDRLVKPHPGDPRVGKVRSLFTDRDGALWLGTHDGLVRVRQGQVRSFGEAEGLERADFYQLLADDRGDLWVGAGHGILRISRASIDALDRGQRQRLEVLSFDVSDQGREVGATRTRQPCAWKGPDGRLWFATRRGVVSVDPAHVRLNTSRPPVLIEEALVDGRPAERGVANRFPPGSGAMEFHFSAITFLEPNKAQHRYLLEGFDRQWISAGTRRVAYYTNVRPGHYRFRVQGSNADGVWNEAGDVLELTLAPHFHQTWLFYAAVALVVLGLVLAFHRMRLGQLKARYAATYAERNRMARELHDSLLQGMSAALMRLRGLRKLFKGAITRPDDPAVASEITEIEEVVAGNIEETRRLLWDLRGEAQGPTDLGGALESLVRKLGNARGAAMRTTVEGTASLLPRHVCRELLLITQEAITNALTHGAAKAIEVRLCYEDQQVRLLIRDDGRGFDPALALGPDAGHFGLKGMRERAASLGALVVDSRPGQGTRVEVTVSRREMNDV